MYADNKGNCMSQWFEKIIEKVTPETEKPIIVIDSQKYLELEELQENLKQKGYTLKFANPGIEVRMKYEIEIKGHSKIILVVLGKYCPVDDIKESAFVIELNSKEIFRNFDEKAICSLTFKELCRLDKIEIYKELNYDETKKLINEKVKTVSVQEQIEEATDLISNLHIEDAEINNEKVWFSIAQKIGECGFLTYKLQNEELEKKFNNKLTELNFKFQKFIDTNYEGLFSKSAINNPCTIDKVQDFIASNSKNKKVAFIVIDGMNFWQWAMLKHALEEEKLKVEEHTSLSWLPSITAWARQSIFKGAKPDVSIDNRTESDLFKKFWIEKQHKQTYQIQFQKVLTKEKLQIPVSDIKVAGFVINALDEMMHGTILGYKQLFQSTNLWIKQSEIAKSINELRNSGFDIYISTDHGNIATCLNLKLTAGQKTVMNSRSKRFVQFDTEEQAENYISANTQFGLGRRYNNVYFKDTNGFGSSGQSEITHGGSHIMELLIPVGVVK